MSADLCGVTLAAGYLDLPCCLAAAHDGDHELSQGVKFATELAMQSHEARAIALSRDIDSQVQK